MAKLTGNQGVFDSFGNFFKFTYKTFLLSLIFGLISWIGYFCYKTPYYAVTDTLAIEKATLHYKGYTMPLRVAPYLFSKYLLNNPNAYLITDYERNHITQKYTNYDGRVTYEKSIDILKDPHLYQNKLRTLRNISNGFDFGIFSSILFCIVVFFAKYLMSRKKPDQKIKRGAKKVSSKELAWIIKRSFKASYLNLADVPMIKNTENQHLLYVGKSGGGKSNAINQTLEQIQQSKVKKTFGIFGGSHQKVIIVDTDGSLTRKFYNEERGDLILNSFDKRTVSTNLGAECRQEPDFESIAAALVTNPDKLEDIWPKSARMILAELLRKMYRAGTLSNVNLNKHVYEDKIPDLEQLLQDTGANKLINAGSTKMTLSCLMSCFEPLQLVKYMPDHENVFSIRDWVGKDDGSWLFITCKGQNQLKIMRSMLTYWITCALLGLQELGEDKHRRVWIVIDELFNLERIPSLPTLLREIRKYGGCMLLAFQNVFELESIYGTHVAKSLINTVSTMVMFANSEKETADNLSKLLGEQEVDEKKYSYTVNPDGTKTTTYHFENSKKRLVLPEEIENLKAGEAYIKLGSNYPVAKIKFKYIEYKDIAKDFDLLDNINIEVGAEKYFIEKKNKPFIKASISSFYFDNQKLVIMLSNHERLSITSCSIPALSHASLEQIRKIALTEDKQALYWQELGVMLDINNIKAYIEDLNKIIKIKKFVINDGFLGIDLSDNRNFLIPLSYLGNNLQDLGLIGSPLDENSEILQLLKLNADQTALLWDGLDMKISIDDLPKMATEARKEEIAKENK